VIGVHNTLTFLYSFGQTSRLTEGVGVNASNYRGHEVALSANSDILYVTSRYRVNRRRDDEDEEGGEEADEEGEEDEDEKVTALNDEDNKFTAQKDVDEKKKKKKLVFRRQFPWSLLNGGAAATPKPAIAPPPTTTPAVLQPGFLTAILLTNPDTPGQLANTPPRAGDAGAGYPIQVILQVSTSTSGGKSNAITPAHWANEYVALADSEKGLVQVWRFDGLNALPREAPPAPPPPAPAPSPTSQPKQQPSQNPRPKNSNNQQQPTPQGNPWAGSIPRESMSRPNPWQSPNSTPGSRGWGGAPPPAVRRELERRQAAKAADAFADVRANIVAEWKAPAGTVGEGDPAAPKGSSRDNDDKKDKAPKWGRGCCANAVWYD
jgi:hypothetical protein